MNYDIGWIDLTFGVVLLVSAIVGLVRGFVFEVLSLVGWLVAWIAAQMFHGDVAPHVPFGAPGSMLNIGVAFVGTFFVVLLAWSLLARVVRLLVHATPLSVIDRLLGGAFGVVRGVFVLLLLATVVLMTSGAHSPMWRESRSAGLAEAALRELKPLLPEPVVRRITTPLS